MARVVPGTTRNTRQRVEVLALLEGTDEEDVLAHIATVARQIDGADACALVLPGRGGDLVMEIVTGPDHARLLGLDLTDDARVRSAFENGAGQLTASLATADDVPPALARYGPALFAPMRASGQGVGVLVLLRRLGAPAFKPIDLALSRTFAAQAALAFVLAEARRVQGQTVLHDERTRIARDLHDLAIEDAHETGQHQQIGAAGGDAIEQVEVEGAPVRVAARVQRQRGDICRFGQPQRTGVGLVAGDQHEFDRQFAAFARSEQRGEIAAAARGEDGDAG